MKSDNLQPSAPKGFQLVLRALHHRNYRLYFGGQSISLIGTWMQQIAVSWLTYRLTHSTVLLGVVGFSSLIPAFILAPFAGVFIDRWDRHRILVVTQILSMIQALLLAILVLTNTIAIWHIISLSLMLGFINAFDNPTRQSFVIDMVENKDDLGNAIALNSSIFHAARLVGPSIAGILIALVGEGVCFLLNGLSFIAVILSLLAMKIIPKKKEEQNVPLWRDFKEGVVYTFGFRPIRTILMLVAWGNLMGMSYLVLLPVFAKDIFHGGAYTQGFFLAASGCGAFLGAIYLASRKNVLGLDKIVAIASGLFGIGLIIFSLSRIFWLSLLMMMVIGLGWILRNAGCNTSLQTIVDEDKRGRMMSLYSMANIGVQPFGSLLAGTAAHLIGATQTIVAGGVLCILGAFVFAGQLPSLRQMVRPIYVKRGIIAEEQAETPT